MKNLLCAFLIVLIPTAIFSSQPAHAGGCSDFASYIRMPNGKCHNLGYIELSTASSSLTASTQQAYQQQLRNNAILDTSESFRKNETKEERAERIKDLSRSNESLNKTIVLNQDIQSWAFTQHLRVLNAVSGQLAPRRGVASTSTSVTSSR